MFCQSPRNPGLQNVLKIFPQRHRIPAPCAGVEGKRSDQRNFFSGPLVRLFAVLLIVMSQCPAFAAGLIMAASTGSEHAASCSLGSNEITVVLAHDRTSARPHHHTLAEHLILRSGTDGKDHPDHRFRFSSERSTPPGEDLPLEKPPWVPIAPSMVELTSGSRHTSEETHVPAPLPPCCRSLQMLLLASVVIRC